MLRSRNESVSKTIDASGLVGWRDSGAARRAGWLQQSGGRSCTQIMGSEAYIRMFLDEARVGAGLHHANIAQVFEVGSDHGIPYMVMEFVNGPNWPTSRVGSARSARTIWADRPPARQCGTGLHTPMAWQKTGPWLVHPMEPGNIDLARGVPNHRLCFAKWRNRSSTTDVGSSRASYTWPRAALGSGRPFRRHLPVGRVSVLDVGRAPFPTKTRPSSGSPPAGPRDPSNRARGRLPGRAEERARGVGHRPRASLVDGRRAADMLEAFVGHPQYAP